MASLVPEPIEKWAVWAASPTSTTLPDDQRGARTVTKLIHLELLAISGRPSSASANSCEHQAIERSSLRPGGRAPAPSRPAARQQSTWVSTMKVFI